MPAEGAIAVGVGRKKRGAATRRPILTEAAPRSQDPWRQPLLALDQFFWIFQMEPLASVTEALNCQAHLSAFSLPCRSYQPVPRGSVSVSASSGTPG